MAKPLLCLFGLHKWAVRSAEDGGRYRECVRCQKVDDWLKPPPESGLAGGA